MDTHSLFDWISVLGPILLSWPLVIAAALALFYRPLFKLLEKASDRKVQKAKIGPFEIEETEQPYIEALKILFTSFVSQSEFKHLQQLDEPDNSFFHQHSSDFISELEHLHALGFIAAKTPLSQLPEDDDLKHHLELTAKGKKYLILHDQIMADSSKGQ